MLPKTVSPVPLFKQMEKLELAKKDHEERLLKVKELNLEQRLVPLETFEKFARIASQSFKETTDFNQRRMILQKFVRRVEIGVNEVKIHWLLDKVAYESELKIKTPGASRGFYNFSANVGSQSLTIGARDWTRTSMLCGRHRLKMVCLPISPPGH